MSSTESTNNSEVWFFWRWQRFITWYTVVKKIIFQIVNYYVLKLFFVLGLHSGVISFYIKGGKDAAIAFLHATKVKLISNILAI